VHPPGPSQTASWCGITSAAHHLMSHHGLGVSTLLAMGAVLWPDYVMIIRWWEVLCKNMDEPGSDRAL